jgi:hypothetical protein
MTASPRPVWTALCLAAFFFVPPAASQDKPAKCKPEQFAALIDETGAYLAAFSNKHKPVLHAKFEKLGAKRKWPAEATIERGYQFVQDATTAKYDDRARKLLLELDRIDGSSPNGSACAELERLRSLTVELRTATEAKYAHMSKRVDIALTNTQPKRKPSKPKRTAKKPPTPAKIPPWSTQTKESPSLTTAMSQLPAPQPLPASTTFTTNEISRAGKGFFGSLSADLASIIRYSFRNYGKPNGYILGTEGGGAFLAGLSFGKGKLVTKTSKPMKVFWQNPTVGYDLGAQGGRVMFLVYNLREPSQLFRRYLGVGGSAYVVGGAGLTFHKRGKVVLAPIRTGVGLRVGANIGYLKFTPKPSINPF